ncbi:MAG: hypothetical protein ACOX24_02515 [Christensenellales bacterium]|jgi:hypothetical protein|nr:hypothetical protein [Clostridiales bacterium]
MKMVFTVMFPIIALATIVWSVFCIIKLHKLKIKFKSSTLLFKLKPRQTLPIIGISLLSIFLVLDIVYLISKKEYAIGFSIFFIIISFISLLEMMFSFKSGILDCGLIIPYKFIPKDSNFSFSLDERCICFYGDKKGFDTITSAITRLYFDAEKKTVLLKMLNNLKSS